MATDDRVTQLAPLSRRHPISSGSGGGFTLSRFFCFGYPTPIHPDQSTINVHCSRQQGSNHAASCRLQVTGLPPAQNGE